MSHEKKPNVFLRNRSKLGSGAQYGQISPLNDLLNMMGFLAYFPIAYFLFMVEARVKLLGLGQSLIIDGGLWIAFLCAMILIFRSTREQAKGRLESYRIVFFTLSIILMIPLFFGVAIFVGLAFVGGGIDGLMLTWKATLVFGFAYWTFNAL